MTAFQDNLSPYISFAEHVDPSNPSAGNQRLFVDTDHILKLIDSSGTVTNLGQGLSDPMTSRGDLIYRNASNVTARLPIGGAGKVLSSDGTDASWQTPAGGGGVTVQYPGLKPGSPTYDFAGSALDGAFAAHSVAGTFTTSHAKTQGEDWVGSAVELQYSAQFGTIYVTHGNTDLDFTVGGIRSKGLSSSFGGAGMMFGIAALNTSGTGVGCLAYNDGNAYFATVTTYNYNGSTDNWALHGSGTGAEYNGDWWLRVTRVSGTWTGYVSQSGRVWDKTFSTRADSITVAELHFGLFFNNASTYSGRISADYFHVAV